MANVDDVAACIMQRVGRTTTLGLQKLVYYAQAWSLVWRRLPLFSDPIRAWKHGPVVWSLHDKHKGMRNLGGWHHGDASRLSDDEALVCHRVVGLYGHMHPEELRDLAHAEDPWKSTRVGIDDNAPSTRVIPLSLMEEYYTARRFDIVGKQYAEARIGLREAAEMVMCSLRDTVAEFDVRCYARPLASVVMTDQERAGALRSIREHRLRNPDAQPREDYAAMSAIATLRLEGVDARPWILLEKDRPT